MIKTIQIWKQFQVPTRDNYCHSIVEMHINEVKAWRLRSSYHKINSPNVKDRHWKTRIATKGVLSCKNTLIHVMIDLHLPPIAEVAWKRILAWRNSSTEISRIFYKLSNKRESLSIKTSWGDWELCGGNTATFPLYLPATAAEGKGETRPSLSAPAR